MEKIKRVQSQPEKSSDQQSSSASKISRNSTEQSGAAPVEEFGSNAAMIEMLKDPAGCNSELKTGAINPYSIAADGLTSGPVGAAVGIGNNVANNVVGGAMEQLGLPCNVVDTFRGGTTMFTPFASGEDIAAVMEAIDPVYDKHYDELIETIKSPDERTMLGAAADTVGAWIGAPFDWISSKY